MGERRVCPTCGTRYTADERFCGADGTALHAYAPPPPAAPALVADRYELGPVLGTGALAVVHDARDRTLGRRVALKLLRDVRDPAQAARLQREANALARLSGSHIVALQGAGVLPNGGAYLALEWVDGPSLREILAARGGRLEPDEALDVAMAIASALEDAHAIGVLHRDIAPNNVLVPRRGAGFAFADAKLADFGVHGMLTEPAPDGQLTTIAGPVVGTPRYMAPEQLLGARNTPATDLFGLGVVLYEMLFGRSPFGESAQNVVVAQLRATVEIPAESALPPELRALLRRLLDREPTGRPQRAHDVLLALRDARRDLDVAPGRTTDAFPIAPSVVDAPPRATPAIRQAATKPHLVPAVESRRAGKRTAMLAVAALVGVLVIVVVAVMTVGRSAAPPGPPVGGPPDGRVVVPTALRALAQAVVVFGVGGLVFALVSRLIAHRHAVLTAQTADLTHSVDAALFGAMPLDRDGISMTIVTTVEAIIQRCKSLDERIIGQTIVAIAHEYASDASTPDSRMAALVQIPQQIEKLSARIAARSTPWYVRHEKLLAAAVSGTAVVGGLAKTVIDVMAATGGKAGPH